MRRTLDLSVAQRMSIGFAAMLGVIVALGLVVAFAHQRAADAQLRYEQQALPSERAAHALEVSVMRLSISLRTYMRQPTAAHRRVAREAVQRVQQAWAAVVALEGEGANEIAMMKSALTDYADDASITIDQLRGDWESHADRLAAKRDTTLAELRAYSSRHEFIGGQRLADVSLASAQAERAALIGALVTLALFGVIAMLTARAVQRPVRKLMSAATALERGDWQPALALDVRDGHRARDELLRLGHAVAASAEAMKHRNDELEAEARLAACAATLDLQQVADSALRVIVDQLGAPLGVVYRYDGERLAPLARYGLPAALPSIELGEGLPGEAARQRRLLTLADLPADSRFLVQWGYDAAPARELLAMPIEHRGDLLGVLLVGSLHAWPVGAERFVRTAVQRLSDSLANAEAHRRIAALLAELARSSDQVQRQNERIQAQNEELQAQYEEIQAQNEELQARTEEVLSQQDQLQAKNDELLLQRRQLREQAEQLIEADHHKNHFLGVLAHELRNPMAPISNGLQILMQHACAPEQVDKIHAMLSRQTRHLIRLIDDLLDITRISEKKIELKRETVELGELVRHVVDDYGTQARELDLRVDLQTCREPVYVDGDPTRLSQITGNLLSNALKFSPPGADVRVRLHVDADRERVQLTVVDAGEGIAADVLPRVFEPFVQGTGHARGNAGLGLGLALVRELVALHGGCVQAYSHGPGQGARFVVELPVVQAPPTGFVAADSEPAFPARRILLIEDKADVADSLATLLRLYGHEVLDAPDATTGIETACDWQPDLVLCDLGLPDLDGFVVARQLRRQFGDRILLCALSGHATDVDRQRSEAAGFDHHFAKPLDIEQLHRLLARVVES